MKDHLAVYTIQADVCIMCGSSYSTKEQNGDFRCSDCMEAMRINPEHEEVYQDCLTRTHLCRKYKFPFWQYFEMMVTQKGRCAICRKPPKKGRTLAVDHDHETGVVRGLLCSPCNLLLGLLHDSIEWLVNALAYLNKHHSSDALPTEIAKIARGSLTNTDSWFFREIEEQWSQADQNRWLDNLAKRTIELVKIFPAPQGRKHNSDEIHMALRSQGYKLGSTDVMVLIVRLRRAGYIPPV